MRVYPMRDTQHRDIREVRVSASFVIENQALGKKCPVVKPATGVTVKVSSFLHSDDDVATEIPHNMGADKEGVRLNATPHGEGG